MKTFTPADLEHWSSGTWMGTVPDAISGFTIDSRKVEAGNCFVAIRTEARDGHAYVNMAAEAGASAAIVSTHQPEIPLAQLVVPNTVKALQRIAAAHRQTFERPVIGITGSCGKTSTKELLAILLGDTGIHRTAANLNNHLGVPLTLLEIDPEVHQAAVIEAGTSGPGEIELLATLIDPDASIITMVAEAHLDGLGTVERVAHEKSRLGKFTRSSGFVVIHEDCCVYPDFHDFPAALLILTQPGTRNTLGQESVVYWTDELQTQASPETGSPAAGGCQIHFRQSPNLRCAFTVPTRSPGMLRNAAMAIQTALRLGVSQEAIAERLLRWRPADKRGELVEQGANLFYIDCYNANPASMKDAFATFAASIDPTLPRLYILGCMEEMGDQSANLHFSTGTRLSLRDSDRVLIVGDDAEAMRDGILSANGGAPRVHILNETREAAPFLFDFAGAVFLKGSRRYRLESLYEDFVCSLESQSNAPENKGPSGASTAGPRRREEVPIAC